MKKVNLILDIGGVIVLFDKTKKNTDDLWASEKLNQELLNYLLANKNKYRYLPLTNNYPDIEKLLVEKFKLPKFYEGIVNSTDVGFAKPRKEIYHHALAMLNAKPKDCVFVDDNAANVEAARAIGMRGIMYENFTKFRSELETPGLSAEDRFLDKSVAIIIDRPLGSKHPKWGFVYEVNYGYVPNTKGGDGEEVDAYVLGVSKPLKEFSGKCIAVIHRTDDNDDKLVVVPEGVDLSDGEIRSATNFQEKYFKSIILRNPQAIK